MKIHINIKTLLAGLLILLLALPFVSCNDDDNGLPVIHRVRTTDPELKDSTFVKATPGQMLLIEGENLGGVKNIYINGQKIDFNPNYVSSKTIIVKIPNELELTGTNPELPKEIWLENNAGTTSFTFHVLSPEPSISRLEIEYPINPGDAMVMIGENFYEIEKITLEGQDKEGEPTGMEVEVTQYNLIGKDYKIIRFALPEGAAEKGEVVLQCAAGEARFPYATRVQPPVIQSFSSDMPVIGTEFYIVGAYFINVEKININGEYDILAEDLRVVQSSDTIYMKLPSEPAKSGIITITAAGGNSDDTKLFYPKEYVILDYDNVGSYSWGEGKVIEGDGENPPYITTGKAGGIIEENVSGWNFWFGNLVNNIEYTDFLSDNILISNLTIRFECFVAYPLSTIQLEVSLGDDLGSFPGYVPTSMKSGKTEIGRWMTCEIPLFSLASGVQSYGDIKAKLKELEIHSKNPEADLVPKYEIFFDNFRIAPKNGYILFVK